MEISKRLDSNLDTVSVITPLHNCAAYITDTIKSVLQQSWPRFEMLIVDDCSTDASVEIVHSFAERDSRIKVVKLERNSGPAVARNTAIEMATGRYIAFLDSDDLWRPEKLKRQIAFMQSTGCSFSYTHYEKISESGEPTGHFVKPPQRLCYKDMLKSNQIGCLTAVYDASILGKMYMPLIRKRQDYGLWLSILKREAYAYCVPELLALYRLRSSSVSSNKVEMLKYNWMLFRQVETLSVLRSAYYVGWNVVRKMLS